MTVVRVTYILNAEMRRVTKEVLCRAGPDVRDYRIRLVQSMVHTRRYTERTTRAVGSGYRSSSPHRLAQPKQPFQLRRESHFRQIRATIALIRLNEEQFPVTP